MDEQWTNPRSVAKSDHPCDPNSRWRKFVFTRKDNVHWQENILSVSVLNDGAGPYILSLNGHYRTVSQATPQFLDTSRQYDTTKEYKMCGYPQEELGLDGQFFVIADDDGNCRGIRQLAVNFTGYENLVAYKLIFEGSDMTQIDVGITDGAELILKNGFTGNVCNEIPEITEDNDTPIFGKLPDGSWVQWDPRVVLKTNTPDEPIPDGGGSIVLATGGQTLCSNAPRTFLNEEQCFLSSTLGTCNSPSFPEISIPLNDVNIQELHGLTGRYVYSIEGLVLKDNFNNVVRHPCTLGFRSRWKMKPAGSCNPTELQPDVNETLFTLLLKNSDLHPYLRDIEVAVGDGIELDPCNYEESGDPLVEILLGDNCFEHVHPEHMSVYDMVSLRQCFQSIIKSSVKIYYAV